MAIFKKLAVGATVATSGTRVFKKLTTEEPLPIWNGTDLTGTTWHIPSGWSAEAGYGVFDVVGVGGRFVESDIIEGGILHLHHPFNALRIGYSAESAFGDTFIAEGNSLTWNDTDWETPANIEMRNTDEIPKLTFISGADVTNTRLINWLLENGELISHKFNKE